MLQSVFRDWVQGFFCSFSTFIVWNIDVSGFLYLRSQYIYNIFRWRLYLPLKISFRLYRFDYNIYLPLKIPKIRYITDFKKMSPWIININLTFIQYIYIYIYLYIYLYIYIFIYIYISFHSIKFNFKKPFSHNCNCLIFMLP